MYAFILGITSVAIILRGRYAVVETGDEDCSRHFDRVHIRGVRGGAGSGGRIRAFLSVGHAGWNRG